MDNDKTMSLIKDAISGVCAQTGAPPHAVEVSYSPVDDHDDMPWTVSVIYTRARSRMNYTSRTYGHGKSPITAAHEAVGCFLRDVSQGIAKPFR